MPHTESPHSQRQTPRALAAPTPVKGCATCAHLTRFATNASAAGDGTALRDATSRMQRHHQDQHTT